MKLVGLTSSSVKQTGPPGVSMAVIRCDHLGLEVLDITRLLALRETHHRLIPAGGATAPSLKQVKSNHVGERP